MSNAGEVVCMRRTCSHALICSGGIALTASGTGTTVLCLRDILHSKLPWSPDMHYVASGCCEVE